ncbi:MULTISPECIES: NrdJb [Corallincola]|uniref:ribonucleoside-diphosphate reductase n=2 Tax=Corallincola TaxID=1775176 RepID=A0ABY1WNA5_9GAMM|nr:MULTISPECIES: NrdJb [Corallincola]TAA45034.1 NrdJb [Corallincola spongiicola]TCI03687.1 NrdJb [Corallincola luteus]
MTIKIDKKIVGYKVCSEQDKLDAQAAAEQEIADNVVTLHEKIDRPEMLIGSTYKIKPPVSEHAFYITINDILLNEGTDHEHQRPFEIFINSKNMEDYSWVVALTRVMSAVFRKGGDATFLVEELKAVFDPKGGYFQPGTGVYMPSMVAEIGQVVERHMKRIGLIGGGEMDARQKALIEEKRKAHETAGKASETEGATSFPPEAVQCGKCHQKSVIKMDGCMTCLNCGDSKCG